MTNQLDAEPLRKLQPKLRMIANGSTEVNSVRAEQACSLLVRGEAAREAKPSREVLSSDRAREYRAETDWPADPTPDAEVSVFVQLTGDAADSTAAPSVEEERISGGKANLLTGTLTVAEAQALNMDPAVAFVELGQPLEVPQPKLGESGGEAPAVEQRAVGGEELHRNGEGTLVGVIDVGGFDFAHPDFLDADGGTRFVRIWDQAGSSHPKPKDRGTIDFDYGSEIRKDELDLAIAAAREGGLPAQLLERQVGQHAGSHATHVASIAAGNHGVCRRAWIAGVTVAIPDEENERRRSFYDSTRIAHGVDYLLAVARELAAEHDLDEVPVSINVSLGTNGHAHDDSAAVTRWIDLALASPGRSVCVAAGNAGQERAAAEDDVGYIMGRVHTSGIVKARELSADIEWTVVGGVADISENELELWYGAQDRFAVQVKPPNEEWTDPVEPGAFIENQQLADQSFLSVYNELYHPANGANYISVFLSPLLSEKAVIAVQPGLWLVRLLGRDVRNGSYHAWIERDDPQGAGKIGSRELWRFPSFFSERSFVDSSTVSSLACGQRLISVANLDSARRQVSVTSSQGPTRDGREKPDIAAPGTDILAANGFADGGWVEMSGTSMASPYVAGVAGLMLAANPRLSSAQVGGVIKRTARPLPGADFSWLNDAGYGEIVAERCVAEAAAMQTKIDVTKKAGEGGA